MVDTNNQNHITKALEAMGLPATVSQPTATEDPNNATVAQPATNNQRNPLPHIPNHELYPSIPGSIRAAGLTTHRQTEGAALRLDTPLPPPTPPITTINGAPIPPPTLNNQDSNPSHAVIAVTRDQQQHLSMRLWLQGYTFYEIERILHLPRASIARHINEMRGEIREAQRAELAELAAERIQGFSMVKQTSWQQYEETKNSRWLQLVLKAEENIARVQGVLSDRVQHLVQGSIAVKLYDMDDSAFRAVEAQYQVVGDDIAVIGDNVAAEGTNS